MNINCIICKVNNITLVYSGYNGYVEGTSYDIYKCINCNTNFINSQQQPKELYELIYSNKNVPGYDRYLIYAGIIKNKKGPLKFLSQNESTYYPIYHYLKNKKNIKILEIGCGYGYLTYAIKSQGFDIKGIDISSSAINFAKNNFGSFYQRIDYKDFANSSLEKYDLIIATEVIEHLDDPVEFLKLCLGLLNVNGEILITTPNKNYYSEDAVWQTDLPPVHITWLSKKSFITIGKILGMNVSFFDFSKYYPSNENKLLKYIRTRKEVLQTALIKEDGTVLKIPYSEKNFIKVLIKKFIIDFSFIRNLSNIIYNSTIEKSLTLGILLKK